MASTPEGTSESFDYFRDLELCYLNWSLKNPVKFNKEWLDYWYCSFIALPSLAPCSLEDCHTHDCHEHVQDQLLGSDQHDTSSLDTFASSLADLLGDALPQGAAAVIETWLTTGLVAAVYGDKIRVPRGVNQANGRVQHYYKYAHLRQWLPWQAKHWFRRLQRCTMDDIALRYIDACHCYNMAHFEFTKLYSAAVRLAQRRGQVCGAQYGMPNTSIIWRWILLFQIIGEHVGFVLHGFPEIMSHYLDHPGGGYGHDVDNIFTEQRQNLATDWGGNDGLEVLLSQYIERCPSEISYMASWSNGLRSNLQLQLENSINPMSIPNRTSKPRDHAFVHAHCSKAVCARPVPSNEDYVQQHIEPGCRCESLRPSRRAVIAAIRRSRIPLIYLRSSEDHLSLDVVEYQEGMKFLAISHVWSDGRGSLSGLDGNSLPLCQLKFLQDRCHLQRGGTGWSFWMDTLCIPNDDPVATVKYRPKAIGMMNQVYLQASEVRVLCNDLLQLDAIIDPELHPTSSLLVKHNIDSWAAIWTSSWMRRCWTFQEGVFGGKKLVFVFRDHAVSINGDVKLPLYAALSPLYSHFTKVPQIFSNVRNWTDREQTAWIIEQVLREYKWRETKYLEDTVTIFAGILGLDVERIAAVDYDQPGCMVQRLKMTFERISEFPTSVLFSRVPRINVSGRSWVPQTLHIPDLITTAEMSGPGSRLCSNFMAKISQEGLLVWAFVVVFRRPPTHEDLPQIFSVDVDRVLKGPNLQCPVTLEVARLEMLEVRGPNGTLKSPAPRATSQYFAAVLRAFPFEVAKQRGFTTDAFVVELNEIDPGLNAFKAFWRSGKRPGLLSRIKDSIAWPAVLRGRYLCAASVHSAPGDRGRNARLKDDRSEGWQSATRRPTDISHASSSSFARSDTDTQPLLSSAEMPAGHVVRRRQTGESSRTVHASAVDGYEMRAMMGAAVTSDRRECFEGIYPGDTHLIMIS